MARNKVIGFVQKITFKEFLPLLLGKETYSKLIGDYEGYDSSINATVTLEFALAGFRIEHTLFADRMTLFDFSNQKTKSIDLKDMSQSFLSLKVAEEIDVVVNGMMRSPCKERNLQVLNALTKFKSIDGTEENLFETNI